MTKRKLHRVSVYLLDPTRKWVLLAKSDYGPYSDQYLPLTAPLNDSETPLETIRTLVTLQAALDFVFMGHGPAMPMVLDDSSVKLFPPLHMQYTTTDQQDYIDFVYLAQAKTATKFPEGDKLGWFNHKTLKNSPNHVKHVVHHVLALMNH